VVELSKGDFTSGLRRPLEAEIDKRPLLTFQKTPITNERYTVDKKHVCHDRPLMRVKSIMCDDFGFSQ
jgi:hypothetical protein